MKNTMVDDASRPQDEPTVNSVEADFRGLLSDLHERVITLLRQSSLDENGLKLLAKQMKVVIQNVGDDLKQIKQMEDWNPAGRLESAYEEIRGFAEELSSKDRRQSQRSYPLRRRSE
jgi:hypothetical protein